MPGVNIYIGNADLSEPVCAIARKLRQYIAIRLSGSERVLTPEEVSIRLVQCADIGMIAPLELEISAFHYAPRVVDQDLICRDIAEFIGSAEHGLPLPHVWLALSELGHSWNS